VRATPLAPLPEVLLLEPRVFVDARGHFVETWQRERYTALGVAGDFVQDNVSVSRGAVLRGLHFQHPQAQGKLVSVLRGRVFDVAVDIRRGSPTFAQWVGAELDDVLGHQLWIPPGFAHGFVTLSDDVVFAYKCTQPYVAAADRVVAWDDPDIGIAWPIAGPSLSAKDAAAPRLHALPADALPLWEPASA
jgi:dTDP-4-dehydrorhamnose 3,5-epimerase